MVLPSSLRYTRIIALALLAAVGLFLGSQALSTPGARHSSGEVENVAEAETAGGESAARFPVRAAVTAPGGAKPSAAPGRIIVKFREGTSLRDRALARSRNNLTPLRQLPLARAELVKATGAPVDQAIRALRQRPDVEYAEPDYIVRPTGYKDEPSFGQLWGLNNTGQAIQGVRGTSNVDINGLEASSVTLGNPNLVIAVIDDGVDFSHPDLAARKWVNPGESGTKATNRIDDDRNGYVDDVNGWDFYNNDKTVHDPVDNDAHGTHVAGTIAASINGRGVVGVAPNVKVMALKFLGPNGGSTSDAITAIEYATKKGVVISNNSWGGPGYSQALKDAIDRSGQLFVAAAGNSTKNQDTNVSPDYPAAYSSANLLAVAAVDNKGALASFSNYGARTVDISAPGVNILSSVPGGYSYYSGTSMAAPHVAGVAALLRSVNAGISPASMKSIIMSTGKAAPATSGKTVTGKIADARAALVKADTSAPAAKPPVQSFPTTAAETSALPIALAWPAATESGSGVARYQLQKGANGTFADVPLSSPTARSRTVSVAPGLNTYAFRVRAYDRVGNVGAWATGPAFKAGYYQEGSPSIAYSRTWQVQTVSGAYGGGVKFAVLPGESAKLTFTGRNIAWVSTRGTTYGKADVYLDGVKVATVDLYASAAQPRRIVFSRAVSTGATHTLEVRVLGTMGRPRVDVDAFLVLR